MEWNATWNDPLTSYVAAFDQLIGDQRTRRTFGETIRGIIGAGSLVWKPNRRAVTCPQSRQEGSPTRDSTGDGGKDTPLRIG